MTSIFKTSMFSTSSEPDSFGSRQPRAVVWLSLGPFFLREPCSVHQGSCCPLPQISRRNKRWWRSHTYYRPSARSYSSVTVLPFDPSEVGNPKKILVPRLLIYGGKQVQTATKRRGERLPATSWFQHGPAAAGGGGNCCADGCESTRKEQRPKLERLPCCTGYRAGFIEGDMRLLDDWDILQMGESGQSKVLPLPSRQVDEPPTSTKARGCTAMAFGLDGDTRLVGHVSFRRPWSGCGLRPPPPCTLGQSDLALAVRGVICRYLPK